MPTIRNQLEQSMHTSWKQASEWQWVSTLLWISELNNYTTKACRNNIVMTTINICMVLLADYWFVESQLFFCLTLCNVIAYETSCKQTKYPPTHFVVGHAPCTFSLFLSLSLSMFHVYRFFFVLWMDGSVYVCLWSIINT